jgi:hypothetical protein
MACVLSLAWGVAGAATPQRAVFRVSLTGTLTKDWTISRESQDRCVGTTRSTGRWRMRVATRRKSTVRFVSVGRRRPLRIDPAIVRAIAGTATQAGTVRCGQSAVRTCATKQVRFRNASVRLLSPRRGFARFARTRGIPAVYGLSSACPEEPVDIRILRTDLDIAEAPLDAADVFDREVTRFFISGNTTQQTTVSGTYEGLATERVRWTLTFTRVR